jgi:hypothetical protein
MFVFYLNIQLCIICTVHTQQKPTTWLRCFSKHPAFQQINVQIYRSLLQLVLTNNKSGKMCLHLVHIDMYSFLFGIYHWHSCSYTAHIQLLLLSQSHYTLPNIQLFFPPVLIIFTILSKVSNKSLVS